MRVEELPTVIEILFPEIDARVATFSSSDMSAIARSTRACLARERDVGRNTRDQACLRAVDQ